MKKLIMISLLSTFLISSLIAEVTGVYSGKTIDNGSSATSQVSISFSDLLSIRVGFRTEDDEPRLSLTPDPDTGIATGEATLFWDITAPFIVTLKLELSQLLNENNNSIAWEMDVYDGENKEGAVTTSSLFNIENVNEGNNQSTGERNLRIRTTEDYRYKPAGNYEAEITVAITIS